MCSSDLYFILLVFAWIVMTAAIVVTLITGIDYCLQAAKLYREAKSDGGDGKGLSGQAGPNADGPDGGAGPDGGSGPDGDGTRA